MHQQKDNYVTHFPNIRPVNYLYNLGQTGLLNLGSAALQTRLKSRGTLLSLFMHFLTYVDKLRKLGDIYLKFCYFECSIKVSKILLELVLPI